MKVKILDVAIENVVKGKSRYSKASVAYSFDGQARTQNIMSFVNPDVFKKVQESVGQEVDVTITKNDAGYNTWAAIGPVGSAPSDAPSPASPTAPVGLAAAATRVTGSNYETPAERAQKQVYIVKQSSLSNAIAFLQGQGELDSTDSVRKVAQEFVDFVFDTQAPPVTE